MVSWRKKDCGISQETKLCKTEVPCPRKKATPLESIRQCMKRISSAVSWLREDGKGKTKRDMELGEEVREEVGKRTKSQGER